MIILEEKRTRFILKRTSFDKGLATAISKLRYLDRVKIAFRLLFFANTIHISMPIDYTGMLKDIKAMEGLT